MFRQWKYGIGLAAVLSFLVGNGIPADASMQSQRQFEMQGEDGAGQTGERWRKVSGTIKKMKNVALNNRDQENLVIEMQSRHGPQRIVDLGLGPPRLERLEGRRRVSIGKAVEVHQIERPRRKQRGRIGEGRPDDLAPSREGPELPEGMSPVLIAVTSLEPRID